MPRSGLDPVRLPEDIREPGRRLLISSPVDNATWTTRIARSPADDSLTVFAPCDPHGPVRRHPGSLLHVEIPTDFALYRCSGTLIERVSESAPLWVIGDFVDLERVQRRTAPRYQGYFGAELLPAPPRTLPIPAPSFAVAPTSNRNLSTSGCYLPGSPRLDLGTPVTVILHLDTMPKTISLPGTVVRHASELGGELGHGIQFTSIDRSDQQAIARFIAAHTSRGPAVRGLIA